MVAKFVNLNKPWSCKYGKIKTNKKATTHTLTRKKNYFTVHHYTQEQNSSPHFPWIRSLRKQTFRLVHRRWGTFREEERLRLSDRNSILMTYINVYIINPVVMGFQMQICSSLVDFGKVLCSSANEPQQNSIASCREEYIPQYLLFCYRFTAFTFDLRSL